MRTARFLQAVVLSVLTPLLSARGLSGQQVGEAEWVRLGIHAAPGDSLAYVTIREEGDDVQADPGLTRDFVELHQYMMRHTRDVRQGTFAVSESWICRETLPDGRSRWDRVLGHSTARLRIPGSWEADLETANPRGAKMRSLDPKMRDGDGVPRHLVDSVLPAQVARVGQRASVLLARNAELAGAHDAGDATGAVRPTGLLLLYANDDFEEPLASATRAFVVPGLATSYPDTAVRVEREWTVLDSLYLAPSRLPVGTIRVASRIDSLSAETVWLHSTFTISVDVARARYVRDSVEGRVERMEKQLPKGHFLIKEGIHAVAQGVTDAMVGRRDGLPIESVSRFVRIQSTEYRPGSEVKTIQRTTETVRRTTAPVSAAVAVP